MHAVPPTSSARVVVVMGVSGAGKTTVAEALADRLGWDELEGDDLHPAANVEKMRGGTPLDDDDRWPWLALVRQWIDQHLDAGASGVVACSGLGRRHRDRLAREGVTFVHLTAPEQVLERRIRSRGQHFMPVELLSSQLETLEQPQSDEQAVTVDATRSVDAVVAEILAQV